jgi:photosystem II stability/assembly factor-like uncharacterized protein
MAKGKAFAWQQKAARFLDRRKRRILLLGLLISLLAASFWFFDVKDLCAHTPHDPIDALALSPAYSRDQTLFIVIADQLLRSTDSGLSWIRLVRGLDHKRFMSSVAVSPSYDADKTLFVSSDGDGVYRSQDGGDSWVKVNGGLGDMHIGLLSIHPGYGTHKVVLAAGEEGGLYRTEDGGESWHQVMGADVVVSALAFSRDLDAPAVLAGDREGVLYQSADGGQTWERRFEFSRAGGITAIALTPRFSVGGTDGTFFVGTGEGGVFKSVDGGVSFAQANKGMSFTLKGRYGTFRASASGPMIRRSEKDVLSIAVSPDYDRDATVFASLWNEAVFKSEDGGNAWRRYPLGLTCNYQADSDDHKSPHFRDLRISDAFAEDRAVFLGGFDGLFKSTDGGRHWAQIQTLTSHITGLSLCARDGEALSLVIGTGGDGAYMTDDGGGTWTIHSTGLASPDMTNVAFSSSRCADNTAFSTSPVGYLHRSSGSGDHWIKIALGRPRKNPLIRAVFNKVGLPKWLTAHILASSELQTVSSYTLAISPEFASDGTIYLGTRHHGLLKSEDGGLSFNAIWDGTGRSIMDLVISPSFALDKTLFASVRGVGIYKTVDGGRTWQPANAGLAFLDAWLSTATVHAIGEKDIKLAISPHYEVDQTVFAASSAGLFKTTDGGANWEELTSPAYDGRGYVLRVAISPDYENDGTVIISVKGKGLFKSEDGGRTFARAKGDPIADNYLVTSLAFSPSYAADNIVYAAANEQVFRSRDGGDSWELLSRPTRYENQKEVIRYEGTWRRQNGDDFSAGSISYSDGAHARAAFSFVGTGVTWVIARGSDQGIARVYVDGAHVGDVDQFNSVEEHIVHGFSVSDLAYGPHTIVVEATGTKSPESTGYRITVDAFDTIP